MNFTPTTNPDNRFTYVSDPSKESFAIGSSVTLYFNLPFNWDDFIKECSATYRQGLTCVLTKQLEKQSQTYNSCVAKVVLSPEETGLFEENLLTVQVLITAKNKADEISFYGPWEIIVVQPITMESSENG